MTLVLKKALALTNLFLIKFNHRVDRKNGLEGCPWVVNRHALLLSEIDSSVALIDQVVNNMKIVIRILNFPCENHNLEAASAIGANFGQFLDLPGSGCKFSNQSFRIKVQIDVTQPLKRGFFAVDDRGTKS